jgi:hypothetical protein
LFIKLLTSTVLIKLLDPDPNPNQEQKFRIRIRFRIRNTASLYSTDFVVKLLITSGRITILCGQRDR